MITAVEGHKTLVSIMVLIIVAVVLTQVAGSGHGMAVPIGLLLSGLVLILLIEHHTSAASFPYPWDPNQRR